MFKRLVAPIVGVLALAAGLAATPAAAQKSTSVPLLLCPAGCGPTEGDTILMVQMIKEGAPVTLLPQETPGYMYNIREMLNERNWKRTVFSTEDVLIQLAMKWGGTPEFKEFMPDRIPIKFKLLYGETWWPIGKFFVTFDQNVKTIEDLKGKRLSLGLRSQSDWGVYPRLILATLGITPQNTDVRHLTPAALTQQLIDGSTDVAVTVFGMEPNKKEWLIGGPLRQLEASGKPLRYVGVEEATIERVNKKWSTTFTHAVIPAGTLPKQPAPLEVGLVRGYKTVHPDFPDETAYHVVMSVAKMAPKLRELHVLWKIWSPELMVAGLSDENVHPGAKKAYVELGWWGKTKNYRPMTYPE
ncbi:MAG TPA: TAXI family TRAP transporter solute-binding subunit [Burkholderiales bacterium]